MIADLEIKCFDDGVTEILVDGQQIHRVSAFYMSQNAGSLPEITFRICPKTFDIKQNAKIGIYNKDEIAKLMDKDEFEAFCNIWKTYHGGKDDKRTII